MKQQQKPPTPKPPTIAERLTKLEDTAAKTRHWTSDEIHELIQIAIAEKVDPLEARLTELHQQFEKHTDESREFAPIPGPQGPQGIVGSTGPAGAKGERGERGPKGSGFWGGSGE